MVVALRVVNDRAVGSILQAHDDGKVLRQAAAGVVAHADGDVVVAVLVNLLSHHEALQLWFVGEE